MRKHKKTADVSPDKIKLLAYIFLVAVSIIFFLLGILKQDNQLLSNILLNLGTETSGAFLIFIIVDILFSSQSEYFLGKGVKRNGIKEVYDTFPAQNIIEDMQSAQSKIIVLHTWTSLSVLIYQSLNELYQNNRVASVETNIFLLSPGSKYSRVRSLDSGLLDSSGLPDQWQAAERTIQNLNDFLRIKSENEKSKIYVYDAMPILALFQVDNRIYYSPLCQGQVCNGQPWIMIEFDHLNKSKIALTLTQHIEEISKKSERVDSSVVERLRRSLEDEKRLHAAV